MREDINIFVFELIIGIVIGFLLAQIQFQMSTQITGKVIYKEIPEIEQDIINDCSNLSLVETSICLVENVDTFYYYNYSNKDVKIEDMEFERLKEQGGVCKHYQHFYENWGKELGFLTKHVTLLNDLRHGFSVIYSNITERGKGYCILDQDKLIGCMRLG